MSSQTKNLFDYHRSKNYRYVNATDKRTVSLEPGKRRASMREPEQLTDTQGKDTVETDPVY